MKRRLPRSRLAAPYGPRVHGALKMLRCQSKAEAQVWVVERRRSIDTSSPFAHDHPIDSAFRLTPLSPLVSSTISLPAAETLKIILTAVEGKTGKRPHQAFLTLHEPNTGLEDSFPFNMKENGKGKVEIVR